MSYVTEKELNNNLEYYLEKSMSEDIYIIKDNGFISVLTNPHKKALEDIIESLEDINIDNSIKLTDKEIITEEILKR